MKPLKIRDCQKPMVDLITNLDRGNLFASPGTGKTSATLMALASMSVADSDVFPALVVAPKRVANMVWADEIAQWRQLSGLEIVKVLGNEKERTAALKTRADIYIINYESLAWLHTVLDGRWPFKTVVADESTRLKNQRVHFRKYASGKIVQMVGRDGSKNAQALVRHAKQTKHWYNLTGTPAANGLTDLWGQQWPVDFGEALGSSFNSFKMRWFRNRFGSDSRYGIIEPLPHAFKEITSRLRSTSVVIDAYDYFDVKKPIELDIFVELPDKVKAMYKKVHKEAVLEMASGNVTAVNAGSALMKCRQIASGCIRDDDGIWHTLHKEKLQAVEELIEEINGENLVIAYWFQHDLKALQNKFPQAVLLESNSRQKKVVDDWNNGKIPILLIHAQSAGHGLSLQHGGRHLCVYTQDWNAEYYAQVIERLGPIRQAQSGYDRLVYVHRLIAKNTCEEVIAEKQKDKLTMDEAIRRAVAMEI